MKDSDIKFEDITGRYFFITVDKEVFRIYVEESGTGIPLICLHTAGSDSRQFRHILNDKEITKKYLKKSFLVSLKSSINNISILLISIKLLKLKI